MKKQNNLKSMFDNLVILLAIISGVFFYFSEYKRVEIFQYLFIVSLLAFGIIYFIDEFKFSEKTVMSSYHILRSIGIIFISILSVVFMFFDS